jgi:hypothetical protein
MPLVDTPGVYSFTIYQGQSMSIPVVVKDVDGDPIDVTGYTARMYFREKITDTEALYMLTTENDRLVMGDDDGTVTVTLSATETAALDPDDFPARYDLELVDGTDPTRVLMGYVILVPEVTR